MRGSGAAIGSALAKWLTKAQAMKEAGLYAGKAVGKGALESIPGLIRDNPRAAASAVGLTGLGLGIGGEELAHDSESSIRHDEDERLRGRAGEKLRQHDPILGPLFDEGY